VKGQIRLSSHSLRILRLFLSRPREPLSGAMIARETSIGSGTLYPILTRLEAVGWLMSEWEQIDPKEASRPRQRFYKLTGLGANSAVAELNRLSNPTGDLAWIS
jgi:PadR family transcriptional regulator PadR